MRLRSVVGGADGQRINGITCLCWNYPCNGFEMLAVAAVATSPRIGYGYQERPGEFLATLALSGVPADYPVRVGKTFRKVADLVEAEKLACRSGGDQSLRLIGLSYYVDEPEWKNDLGETWSLERMIEEEIAAAGRDGPRGRAESPDGPQLCGRPPCKARPADRRASSSGPRSTRPTTRRSPCRCRTPTAVGGRISWRPGHEPGPGLAIAHHRPGAGMAGHVACREEAGRRPRGCGRGLCHQLLGSQRYQWNAPSLSTREIVSMGHALHALATYDERVFRPADVQEKPAPEKPRRPQRTGRSRVGRSLNGLARLPPAPRPSPGLRDVPPDRTRHTFPPAYPTILSIRLICFLSLITSAACRRANPAPLR